MVIPIISPPITPPAIAPAIVPVLTEAVLLSAFAIEILCTEELLVRVVAPGTPRETIGPVAEMVPLLTVV